MVKIKVYRILIILSVFLIVSGCNNTEREIKTLLEEVEQYKRNNNYSEAVLTYEKIIELSDDKDYQNAYEELKLLEDDIDLVEKTIDELKKILFNPESLQVNEVIIYRSILTGETEWTNVYMDYSAMNKMGGFVRDYADATFVNSELKEDGGFFPKFESNYRSAEERIEEDDNTYYFDVDLLKE